MEFVFFGPTMSFEDYMRPGSGAAKYVPPRKKFTADDMPTEEEMSNG